MGHEVSLCGRTALPKCLPKNVSFVSVNRLKEVVKAFLYSDVILLHGGGPLVIFLAIVAGFFQKRIVLDSYVPHWIELDELSKTSAPLQNIKILVKSYFNALRGLFAGVAFDCIIAANRRQEDLYRGIVAPFSLTKDFFRISLIPFGCSEPGEYSRERGRRLLSELADGEISNNNFLIGWLGGTYGWFDLEGVLQEVSKALTINESIRVVFFGVSQERKMQLLEHVAPDVRSHIIFLPWIDFSKRFEYWSGFDISLVWGGEGYENDYASRTRNFDCLTLGLPIVQNWDDEWGARLESTGAGRVADRSNLSDVLYELSISPEKVSEMRKSMLDIAPSFYWVRFAEKLIDVVSIPPMSFVRRFCGVLAFFFILPASLVFFIYNLLLTLKKS
ncbi:hypothetical protein GCM10022394_00380 [Zobellella aerophila]|uniref:Glycosyl transferase family 1 domain-containing protein n=2 Tax=Zobellella aerophila TaxID=870480 RepID=A0ABP6V246_9GAMM